MKKGITLVAIFTFSITLLLGQGNYKCNCKLVYGNKSNLDRITYFNDSLVIKEVATSTSDSTDKLLLDEKTIFGEIYHKVNYRWFDSDTFLILNNVIGKRIGSHFYPYFPPDNMKKGEKFIRFHKYFNNYKYRSKQINAFVFYKIGDTIIHGESMAYFKEEQWSLKIRTSIDEIVKRDLNSFPFINNDNSNTNNSIDFFYEKKYSDPDYTSFYRFFKKGETPYKKGERIELIYLEGDCERFLKGKPTFVKE